MERFSKGFTTFMLTALKVLLLILVCVSIGTIFTAVRGFNSSVIIVSLVYGISIFLGYKIINSKTLETTKKVGMILAIACIVRVLWLLNVNSVPNSDFNTMYECGKAFLQGDTSMFWGTAYIARFPHLTIMVLYMALMIKVFPDPLIAMKVTNLILGVVVVYLIYLIVKKVFDSKRLAMYAALMAAIFPPLVTYTATFCTENIAIPFYLLSIYLFLLVIKSKKSWTILILCGISLAVGNLFRMVAIVMIVAYGLYILIYTKDNIKLKVRNIMVIGISYWIIMLSVSGILQATKITENPLWRGSEPAITSMLKGTHYESGGRWNPEDAALPEDCNFDYDMIEEKSKEIIIERLTTTEPSKLAYFYLRKFAMQWNEGDLAGAFWSQLDVPSEEIIVNIDGAGSGVLQLVYVIVIVLMLIGTFNRKRINKNSEINLFYLILCGYGATYLITESQARYSYIACWVLIILAVVGLDKVLKKLKLSEEGI